VLSGLIKPAQVAQGVSQPQVGLGLVGLDGQCGIEVLDGFVGPPQQVQGSPKTIEGGGVAGGQTQRLLELLNSLFIEPLVRKTHAQIVMRIGAAGADRQVVFPKRP
jgi:hypothetical protein